MLVNTARRTRAQPSDLLGDDGAVDEDPSCQANDLALALAGFAGWEAEGVEPERTAVEPGEVGRAVVRRGRRVG